MLVQVAEDNAEHAIVAVEVAAGSVDADQDAAQ